MNTQTIDTTLIKSNPWQPRTYIDPAAIADLADSIAAQGLLQPPAARAVDGHYELAFGHRRLQAWQIANPGQPMPLQIMELTDRQMAEHAATENAARTDLNPIERARAIKRLIDEFKLTQLEAGKLFGLASQGAVSNAMRMLKLPADVQNLLITGEIAERHARALLPLANTSNPRAMSAIAAHLVKLEDGERDGALEQELWNTIRKLGKSLDDIPWKLTWPEKAIHIDKPNTKLGEPGDVPACKGCPFFCAVSKRMFCLRPACHALKLRLCAQAEAERVSKTTKIAVATPGEKVSILVGEKYLGYDERRKYTDLAKRAEAREHLRLVPADKHDQLYDRRSVTGSEMVMLGTVNRAALDRLAPVKPKARGYGHTSDYDRKQKESEARARECKRLCLVAAPHFASAMPTDGVLLSLLMERFAGNDSTHAKDMEAFKTASDKQAVLSRMVLLTQVPHWHYSTDATPAKAFKKITDLAAKLKVKLPAGWDAKPEASATKKPAAKKDKKG
jgi:ParB/RepB/Spo0J family partition protein